MSKIISLVLLAEFCNAIGQILYKKSVNLLESPHLKSLESNLSFFKKILRLPWIWLGVGSMALGLLVWLAALSEGDLSIVYPIGSLQYLLVLILARVFLGEKIDRMKLFGTFLVLAGIVLITKS